MLCTMVDAMLLWSELRNTNNYNLLATTIVGCSPSNIDMPFVEKQHLLWNRAPFWPPLPELLSIEGPGQKLQHTVLSRTQLDL